MGKHLLGEPQYRLGGDPVHAFPVIMGRSGRGKSRSIERPFWKGTKGAVARATIHEMLQVTVAGVSREGPSIPPTGSKEGETGDSQGLGHVLGGAVRTD